MQIVMTPREYDDETVAHMIGGAVAAINALGQPIALEGRMSAATSRRFVLQGYSLVFHHKVEIEVFEDLFIALDAGGTYPLAFLVDQYKANLAKDAQ